MDYNINYCIISAAYLSITLFFYRRQMRVPSHRNTLFRALLFCALISLLLDIAAAAADRNAARWNPAVLYAVNIVFLSCMQLSGVLFFHYSITLTGTYHRMRPITRLIVLLPFAAAVTAIAVSPFTHNAVFYLDENNVYHHGKLHIAIYAVIALYLLASLAFVFANRRKLERYKFRTITAFLTVVAGAMLIQLKNPYLLVNTTANAFALTLIYHILESPGAHVDALTGVFNRTALPQILSEALSEGGRATLTIYSINAMHVINHSLGEHGGDEVLRAFASSLKKKHPRRNIFRIEGSAFGVLFTGGKPTTYGQLEDIYRRTAQTLSVGGTEVALDLTVSCINSEDCKSVQAMTSLMESVLTTQKSGFLLAGGAYQEELLRRESIEQATARALDEGRVYVYYQPIHGIDGKLCALEALVRIEDPKLGFLPTQEAVMLAEGNGTITRLGAEVLRQTLQFIRDNGVASWGLDHIGVNLSAVQGVRENLCGEILSAMREYGVSPGLVSFEITETVAAALSAVRENMERLSEHGVHFLLDDFGTGYANFRNIAALPYRCIKIDKSLLWNAHKSESNMRLLTGTVKLIHALGLTSLCEGVETKEQVGLMQSLGVSMLQGYYYSKPIPGDALIEYARRAGLC